MNDRSEMGLGDPSAFVSAAEYAYAMLRAGIENGELPPGKRLRETEVSDWLGVSRTPVRQALSRLQTEGLLASGSRSGLVVATLDSDAVTELYEIREVLEGTAAAFAARNATPAEIEALKGMIAEERQLTKTPEALARHNIRFHRALHVAAHNRFLVKSLNALHDAMDLLRPTTYGVSGRPKEAWNEHRAVVEAIAAGDAAAAEAAARSHVRRSFELRRVTFLNEDDPNAAARDVGVDRGDRKAKTR
ncbi:MAG: GntR family transcriptional regulator [Hyphomicrobiaceae bacterium]